MVAIHICQREVVKCSPSVKMWKFLTVKRKKKKWSHMLRLLRSTVKKPVRLGRRNKKYLIVLLLYIQLKTCGQSVCQVPGQTPYTVPTGRPWNISYCKDEYRTRPFWERQRDHIHSLARYCSVLLIFNSLLCLMYKLNNVFCIGKKHMVWCSACF